MIKLFSPSAAPSITVIASSPNAKTGLATLAGGALATLGGITAIGGVIVLGYVGYKMYHKYNSKE